MTKLLEFLKILSDETRLRILILLFSKELCVCEICDILGESQPKVSRHLAKLRDVGFVEDVRQGQWMFYYIRLEDSVESDIINIIIKNIDKYPVLRNDIQRLKWKISQGQLCRREK